MAFVWRTGRAMSRQLRDVRAEVRDTPLVAWSLHDAVTIVLAPTRAGALVS